ncbi:hypothetical protein [Methylobacterium sp. WSM2598]|uniref:hypothetical protein n=1 Tax=Methylobacterium sp. WSM2598 TaxID=398261 RepID=UPI0003724EE6|nr:hypothetical protein [Methylobacterium sp. WSM2598]
MFCPQDAHARTTVLQDLQAHLAGMHLPGGSVDTWLEEVPTFCLGAIRHPDPRDTAQALLILVGRCRGAHLIDPLVDPFTADLTNVAQAPRAYAAINRWAQRILARDGLQVA